MDLIFQGHLTADQDIREVLQDVLALKEGTHGVLRLSDPADNLNGGIYLYRRRYIVGAYITDSPETGYKAVRRLLTIGHGNFAYMDAVEERPPEDNESVCIDMQALLELMPDLPETLPGTVEATDVQVPRKAVDPKVELAAALVRKTTTEQTVPVIKPEASPRLRDSTGTAQAVRIILLWGLVTVVVLSGLGFAIHSLARFIESQQVLKEFDRRGMDAVNKLMGGQGQKEPEAAPSPQPAPPQPVKKGKRRPHRH